MMANRLRKRTLVVASILAFVFVCLFLRVAWLQVVQADELMEQAKIGWDVDRQISAKRGTIIDRNGVILAVDARAYTVAVNPQAIAKKQTQELVVKKLAAILNMSEDKLRDMVTKQANGKFKVQVEVRNEGWKITDDVANRVRALITELRVVTKDNYFNGVLLLEDTRRSYPLGKKAAHLLGYVKKTGEAVGGIEQQYDDILRGKPGRMKSERFAENRFENAGRVEYVPPVDGQSIQLNLDAMVQGYIEDAMDDTQKKFGPKAMMAVAVDPQTMQVIGMANRPTFDPNLYGQFKDAFMNHAIQAVYEPGSTAKGVTLAAAIQENLFQPDATYMSGAFKVGRQSIHDHNYRGWGEITYLEGLVRSSNVGFIKLGYERLGKQRLGSYIHKFGFGRKTNIDLPNEAKGIVRLKHDTDYATATFGQGGVVVSAMQQVSAFAAIANGGKLMKPQVLRAVIDSKSGSVVRRTKPEVISQTVSAETAQKATLYLEQVIANQKIGTGRKAAVPGYRMAGKTGTANKVIGGKYSTDKWVLSFIGYGPVENPRFLLCIIVDEPDLGGDYRRGSEVAPPMFKTISAKVLNYMKVPTDSQKVNPALYLTEATTVPDLYQLPIEQAKQTLADFRLKPVVLGTGKQVVEQFPAKEANILEHDQVYLLTEDVSKIKMPDMKRMALREVMQVCTLLKKTCKVDGVGYVREQREWTQNGQSVTSFTFASLSESAPVSTKVAKND